MDELNGRPLRYALLVMEIEAYVKKHAIYVEIR
jgi:hypothetical protein